MFIKLTEMESETPVAVKVTAIVAMHGVTRITDEGNGEQSVTKGTRVCLTGGFAFSVRETVEEIEAMDE